MPVVGLAVPLGFVIATHRPLYWAMAAGSVIAALSAAFCQRGERREGSPAEHIIRYAWAGVSRIANVIVLILLVNAMTAVWFTSGTIQGLVYYGLSIVSPGQVMVAGLTVSTLVSLMLGSSVGTVATVGVAVMGMAKALGIPLAPVAGAIMSGALFGDRVSFLSPIFHLAIDLTGSQQSKASRRIFLTGAAAWVLAFVAYLTMGFALGPGSTAQGLRMRGEYLAALSEAANIGPWVVLPPTVVILLAMRKVSVKTCLFAGLTVGGAVAVLSQGRNVADVFTSALVGYSQESRVPELASLLRSGGIAGTRDMVILLCSAGVYTGITELSGMMEAAIRPAIGRIKTRTSFLMATMGVSVLSAAFASNQAMSVILPARLMEAKRKETGTSPEDFAGVISDSGVAAAGIIPWNVMAVICAQSLQLSPLTYAPYSFLLLALPVMGGLHTVATARRTEESHLIRDEY